MLVRVVKIQKALFGYDISSTTTSTSFTPEQKYNVTFEVSWFEYDELIVLEITLEVSEHLLQNRDAFIQHYKEYFEKLDLTKYVYEGLNFRIGEKND